MLTIGAIVCNAHLANPEIEFEVVSLDDGDWFNNSGNQVWPFATIEVEFEPSIPDGWIEHLHAEAAKWAATHKAAAESKVEAKSLLASLGLPTTTHNAMVGKLVRRV